MPIPKKRGRPRKDAISVPTEVASVDAYIVSIKVMGRLFTSKGSTVSDAISGLQPGNCKGKAIIIVEKNGIKKEKVLMPPVVFRLFNSSGISREITIKNISLMFQGL